MNLNLFKVTLIIILFNTSIITSQTRATKETKIVLTVHNKSNEVTGIGLLSRFKKMNYQEASKKYPESKFFIGSLKGNYTLLRESILPERGAKIIIYTEKQFFPSENFFPSDQFIPGDNFKIGTVSSKVISSKKGELIIKTN